MSNITAFPIPTVRIGDLATSEFASLIARASGNLQTVYDYQYASPAAAVAAIGTSAPTKYVVSNPLVLTADLTFPANISVKFEAGGRFTVDTGKKVTINSLSDPGNQTVFYGAGDVVLGRHAVREFNLIWWQKADSNVDATKAINNALASLVLNFGGVLRIPPGEWLTTGNHLLPDNTEIIGASRLGTVIKMTANNGSIFGVQPVPGYYLKNLRVRKMRLDSGTATGVNLVTLTGSAPDTLYYIDFEDVQFNGGVYGLYYHSLSNAWDIEYLTFRRCFFAGQSARGFSIDSENSFVMFDDCLWTINPNAVGVYIAQVGTLAIRGWDAFATGTPVANVANTDGSTFIYLEGGANQLTVEGGQDENIHYLIRTSTNPYSPGCISLRNNAIQSFIKLSAERTIYSENNNYFPDLFIDAPGANGVLFSKGDQIKAGTATSKISNFTGGSRVAMVENTSSIVTRHQQFVEYETDTPINLANEILSPAFPSTVRPLVKIIGGNNGQPELFIGDRSGTNFYGYEIYRDSTGRYQVGWLVIEGNQSNFRGVYFKDPVNAAGGLAVPSASASLDFPSIAANGQADLTINLTGAALGDKVIASPNGAPENGLIWKEFVSAAGVVTIRMYNLTAAAINPAARNYTVSVIK